MTALAHRRGLCRPAASLLLVLALATGLAAQDQPDQPGGEGAPPSSPAPCTVGSAATPPPAEPAPAASLPLHEWIDQQADAALAANGLAPAPACDDAEFLRRVYLDLWGTIPTSGQARAFLDDPSPLKRQQLIDRLLNSPEYARHMQRVFDAALMERRPANRIDQQAWEDYLRTSFAANKPWNQLVREMLAADGADPLPRPAARFCLDREADAHLLTRDVGRLLLGRDMQCAQCHDHPLVSDYLQEDYYGLLAFFNRSFIFTPKDQQPVLLAERAEGDVAFKSVFIADAAEATTTPHLPGQPPLEEPKFESGQEYQVAPADGVRGLPKYSRRARLAELLPTADNVAFRRNIANRLWAMMMGRGLVHPLDMDHQDNPPSHPALLTGLADQMAASNFDIKQFLREVALSRTYQRSSQQADPAAPLPPESLAVARLRPLSPEQLATAVSQATGMTDVHRAALGAALNEAELHSRVAAGLPGFVSTFCGQPGQPEQEFQATLEQILFISNGGLLRQWIAPQPGNLAHRLAAISDPPALADELFLSVLSRRPTAEESAELAAALASRAADRPAAIEEWIWALLASNEFRFNH